MTISPLQLYSNLGPSGVREHAVRLSVVFLSFLIIMSSLFSPLPVFPMQVEGDSSVIYFSSEAHTAGLEELEESGDCCPEKDCSDSQGCSIPCVSNCSAPQVVVLDSLLYRDLSNSADTAFAIYDNQFEQPLITALFRPPIV